LHTLAVSYTSVHVGHQAAIAPREVIQHKLDSCTNGTNLHKLHHLLAAANTIWFGFTILVHLGHLSGGLEANT